MPRPATGNVEQHRWADGTTVSYWLRVSCDGKRHRLVLGTNREGWSYERAAVELEKIMGQIARGTWEPPRKDRTKQEPDEEEIFHVTLSRWWHRNVGGWSENTFNDYRWRADHLLTSRIVKKTTASINKHAVDELRIELARRPQIQGGRGRRAKDKRGAKTLSPRSVNMIIDLAAMVLDDAVDYDLLDANPARGRRRRMKVPESDRGFLMPDMVVDALEVAGEWEDELPEHQRYGRRALLASLTLAGPRIIEIIDVERGGLGVAAGELRTGRKTTAGRDRHFELSAFLTNELATHFDAVRPQLLVARGVRLPLFHTRTGGRLSASNVRNRLLPEVVERTNERRAAQGKMLLPRRVTPHTLRRTFASLAFFAGRDLKWTMGQLGHRDARMTAGVYAQGEQRRRIDRDLVWMLMRFTDEPEGWGDRHAR
jgi:integrase